MWSATATSLAPRRRDGDAAGARRREVDRVETDADARDRAQLGRLREDARVERVGADDRGDGAADQPAQLLRRARAAPGREADAQAGVAQRAAEPRVVDVVVGPGDEHDRLARQG